MEELSQTSDESKRPKRNRIASKPRLQPVVDELEFRPNKGSKNARPVEGIARKIEFNLWFDKHYIIRHQHGDENGKREGIEKDDVRNLVLEAMGHLLVYSSLVAGFTFLNRNPPSYNAKRIVCQRELNGCTLNVVIEVHYDGLHSFEVTVFTAMCSDEFVISQGQYVIEMVDDDGSILRKMEYNGLKNISEI